MQRSYIRFHSSKDKACLAATLSQCLLGACACFLATVEAEQQSNSIANLQVFALNTLVVIAPIRTLSRNLEELST